MEIRIENGEKTVVYVSGRIDTQTSVDFQNKLDEIVNTEKIDVLLDFKDVEYVSSAGLRSILYVQKKINSIENSSMQLKNVGPEVMEVLEMTGFTEFLNIDSSCTSTDKTN